jgi:hypothetical protein
MTDEDKPGVSAAGGLEESRAIFERIARLAQRMAEASGAYIALSGPRGLWMAASGGEQPAQDARVAALARLAMQTSGVL